MQKLTDLQLASKSPRRREILQQIGVRFSVVEVDVTEERGADESPADYVARLAEDKAKAGYAVSPGIVTLGSDTIVCCADAVLEKPRDFEDFRRMMTLLSGSSHQVLTAVSLCAAAKQETLTSVTTVHFHRLTPAMIEKYWASREPCDKAGGYGIQGLGGLLVEKIEGSYSGVVGLPIELLYTLLPKFEVPFWNE